MKKHFLRFGAMLVIGLICRVAAYPPPNPSWDRPSGDLPPMTEADILKFYKDKNFSDMPTFADLATVPPAKAWHAYELYHSWSRKYPDVIWKASQAIAKNEVVGPWIEKKILAERYDEFNYEPATMIGLLGYIPSVWSAKLLGKFLFDAREFKRYDGDAGDQPRVNPAPTQAAGALAQMGFWDAPTDSQLQTTEPYIGLVEMWKNWWKANESRIEERMWEINPDYPRPANAAKSLAERAVPTPQAPPPAPEAKPEISKATASPDWVIYLGVGIAALVALLVGALLLRKKK